MKKTYQSVIDKLNLVLPDDEPQEIVCTSDYDGSPWAPGFGVWETNDFELDSDEEIHEDERLFINRKIADAMLAYIGRLESSLAAGGLDV